jgi:hypothetical protein
VRLGYVGRYLGVCRRTVARLIREGEITPEVDFRDRRRKLVSVRELDNLIQRSIPRPRAKLRAARKQK